MMRCTALFRAVVFVAAAAAVAAPAPAAAQDANFLLPIAEIDRILREGEIEVIGVQPSRGLPGERTYRVTLQSGDHVLGVKYAPAREGADEFNNRPRYELAAYEVQGLFLDEREMVVPPTAIRAFPSMSSRPPSPGRETRPTLRNGRSTSGR